VDTIDYKKVVIEGNESEAVAVPAFQGQSHWQYWCGGWRCCGFGFIFILNLQFA
jgi:hypothetical protein